MYAELYALVTAILRGFSFVPIKRGLKHSNSETSVLIYLLVNTAFLWFMTILLYPVDVLDAAGVEYFVLAGILAPGLARLFRDMGSNLLGVAIASPIVSINMFFSMLGASVFLGEEITLSLAAGAILIFFGFNVLTWRGSGKAKWRRRDLSLPIIAALMFASSVNLRKIGLQINSYSILGAAITSTASLAVILISLVFAKRVLTLKFDRNAVKLFGVASVLSSVAFLFYFMALSAGELTKIQPIAVTSSLFAIMFSHFFLKDVEKITAKIVLGAVLIVLGVVSIFL